MHEGDWHQTFDAAGIRKESFNGRMLLWLEIEMGRDFGSLAEAQQAYATSKGAFNWSALDHVALARVPANEPAELIAEAPADDDFALPEAQVLTFAAPPPEPAPLVVRLARSFRDYWLPRAA